MIFKRAGETHTGAQVLSCDFLEVRRSAVDQLNRFRQIPSRRLKGQHRAFHCPSVIADRIPQGLNGPLRIVRESPDFGAAQGADGRDIRFDVLSQGLQSSLRLIGNLTCGGDVKVADGLSVICQGGDDLAQLGPVSQLSGVGGRVRWSAYDNGI